MNRSFFLQISRCKVIYFLLSCCGFITTCESLNNEPWHGLRRFTPSTPTQQNKPSRHFIHQKWTTSVGILSSMLLLLLLLFLVLESFQFLEVVVTHCSFISIPARELHYRPRTRAVVSRLGLGSEGTSVVMTYLGVRKWQTTSPSRPAR